MYKFVLLLVTLLAVPSVFAQAVPYENTDPDTSPGKEFKALLEANGYKKAWKRLYQINESLFLFEREGKPSQAGYYVADIKNQKTQRIIVGLVDILKFKQLKSEKLAFVFRTGKLNHDKLNLVYEYVICDFQIKCEFGELLTEIRDDIAEVCAISEDTGITKPVVVKSASIKEDAIILKVSQTDCANNKTVKKNIKYLF